MASLFPSPLPIDETLTTILINTQYHIADFNMPKSGSHVSAVTMTLANFGGSATSSYPMFSSSSWGVYVVTTSGKHAGSWVKEVVKQTLPLEIHS